MKIYVCNHCGNIIVKLTDKGVPVMCCREPMALLEAGTKEAALEKHVPVFNVDNNIVNVNVGSIDHPMLEEHYIEWVIAKTSEGYTVKHLTPGQSPNVNFALAANEKLLAVYAYCNIHGLWKTEA